MTTPTEASTESAASNEAPDTITVPKSVLGDRNCKPGEKLTFTVTDVDPETGDVEVELAGYGKEDEGESVGDEMARYPMEQET